LIAFTAGQNDATLITYDQQFEKLKELIDFKLVLLQE